MHGDTDECLAKEGRVTFRLGGAATSTDTCPSLRLRPYLGVAILFRSLPTVCSMCSKHSRPN
ncbi:hypothetical protein HSEST_1740 [Halapricum desulfuricans]|uniref:Uncharacterized protein n=1 Tax=Halapricum desulfuricans TaxID=2841257 RepID=A0A897NWY6_9EURY|nr:hypothetical protein HSEST_1740 [Halapricum desulfuricans]